MKLKELLNLMRSARAENTKFTLVDYDIYSYLDGTETEIMCSFSSDIKHEYFLKDSILETEVISMGIKSETEMVFELAKEESKVVDVRCPSRVLDVTIAKNEYGLLDVTVRDLEQDEFVEMMGNICRQFNVSSIAYKDGSWSYSFDQEGDDDNEQNKEEE